MRLIFATNNRHKLEEVSAILGAGFELSTPADHGITEDIPETQATLEGNALQKARYIYERTGLPTFADDTGLEVAALGGAPGVRSARYAEDNNYESACATSKNSTGDKHNFDANNRLLLRNMEGVEDRSARFRTVIALILNGGERANGGEAGGGEGASGKNVIPEEHLFEGEVRGHIIDEYRGSGGFGYDPIFVPEIHTGDKLCAAESAAGHPTFAEMSAEQKNAISHRARAVEKLNQYLKTI
jgi:XTP/dITP diphosphohydrolase